MKKQVTYKIAAIFFVIVCVFLNSLWAAEKYPTHQIELLCGYPPGTGPDILNRILGRYLEKQLGVTIVPVNKIGAGGVVAITTAATSRPDGYTLLNTGDFVIPVLTGQAGYTVEDLRVAAQVALNGAVLVVPTDSPWKTFQDFINDAKKNPGTKYCHPGVSTMAAMRMENLNKQANLKLIGVTAQEVVSMVLGKHVPIGLTANATAKPQVEAGRMRILFSFDPPKGFGLDPTIPDFTSVFGKGVPDIEIATYLAVTAKTPTDIVQVLEKAMETISKDPEFVNELLKNNFKAGFLPGKTVMEEKIPMKMSLIKDILQSLGTAK